MLEVLESRRAPGRGSCPTTSRAQPAPRHSNEIGQQMARAFVIAASEGRTCEFLTACLHAVDGACPIILAPAALEDLHLDELPALVVVGLDNPEDDGAVSVRALSTRWGGAPLVAFGSAVDEPTLDSLLRAGACAYLPCSYTERQTQLVLNLVLEGAGHRPLSRGTEDATDQPRCEAMTCARGEDGLRSRRLTPKQVEVLSLAAEGLSNRQIAARLGIAEGTVKLHMSAIYAKLDVDRRGEAIVMARRLQEVRAEQMRHAEDGSQVLDWLLPHVRHRRMGQGEVIFRTGDASSTLYYIQRGTVVLEEIGVELGPRQILGEIGVFSLERARTCTARCRTDVDLFCLDSEQVKSIYYLNPQFALHVVQLIAQRLLADRQRAR